MATAAERRHNEAQQARSREALAHYAHIRYTLDNEERTANVKWYGYPPTWAKFDAAQRVEWWRQHCVRSFAMPITAVLVGVEVHCWGGGL